MSKKRLDYLAIPNASKKRNKIRKKRAIEEIHKRPIDKILILKGKDSEEDVLYLGKILKKGDRIGFDTFPLHFKEYKEIIKKAIRDKKFPKGVKLELVQTNQPPKLFLYGVLGFLEEHFKKRKLAFKKYRNEKELDEIKSIVKKALE